MLGSVVACKSSKKDNAGAPSGGSPQRIMQVEAMVAQPQTLSADIEIPGTIMANETTEIHPEISGRMTELHIKEGSYVSKGSLLAKLYDGDLQARMRKLDVQLKIAEQTEKRQAELLKIQAISQQDYDLSLLEVQSLKADMDIIREDIRKTEIRAPFSGKLGLKNVSPGAYVTPSAILTTISQVDQIKIHFNRPERYGSQLKNGMPIQFQIDGSSKSYVAHVIASEVKIEENTRSLAIRALVKNKDAALIPGLFAKVSVVLGQDTRALMVPNSSIIPSGRKKQLYLFKGGKATPAEVITGVRDSTNVQIVQGIKAGDTVITSGILFMRPGLDVSLSEIR
jgi:membrane fusion protein (multidrug efflux system)